MKQVVFKDVTKIYNKDTNKEVVAVDNISFEVKKGEFVLLLGASGSGKSTILSLIAGFLKPTSGFVELGGEVISKLPDRFATIKRRESVGFVFQKFNLLEDLSVEENILLPLLPLNDDTKKMQKKLDRVLEMFRISHKRAQKVVKLSGGEQQRCAIARAMINNPSIILADEPTANLDAKLTDEFIEILKSLKDEGKTVVLATHDRRFEELDFVTKKIHIENGRLCF